MNIQNCQKCKTIVEIPDDIEVDNLLCDLCAKAHFGEAYLDYMENNSEDIDDFGDDKLVNLDH